LLLCFFFFSKDILLKIAIPNLNISLFIEIILFQFFFEGGKSLILVYREKLLLE
jgi:hypothetical protein